MLRANPWGLAGCFALALAPLLWWCATATAETPEQIKEKVSDVYKLIEAGKAADPVWRDQAELLRKRISELPPNDPIAVATTRSDEVEALLKTVANSTNPNLRTAVSKLITAGSSIEAGEPVDAFEKDIARLNSLVNVDGFPVNHQRVRAGLPTLKAILTKVTLPLGPPRIHIVSATYGDHSHGARSSRRCDASAGLFKICERGTTCDMPDPMAALCGGYDPAPRADTSIKLLSITYQCVVGTDDDWALLAAKPSTIAAGPSVRTDKLHGPGQRLVCLSPPPS